MGAIVFMPLNVRAPEEAVAEGPEPTIFSPQSGQKAASGGKEAWHLGQVIKDLAIRWRSPLRVAWCSGRSTYSDAFDSIDGINEGNLQR